jgi:hypothetical protein
MKILRMSGQDDGDQTPGAGIPLPFVEVIEGDEEFLEAISLRLEQIIAKPKGRFVISYTQGHPGARRPPTVN